ncbi:hypothetical protein [Haloarcula argentinensis]|uniref:Uncharacterized protein n=1 Tax=Haloarcula argentinensis TaxID=43776 RepID=A0A847UN99_HALAR|nr:hypothetical protein [Haloarcula argentinensis]NLV13304.1 hypothetical protein [Haloarcula argentinensis]
MQPRSLAVGIALVSLVVLGGCTAFSTAGPNGGEQTVTPAPVPTPDPSLPPGVTANSISDPERLGSAHERRLTNRSYTVTVVRTVQFANGTIVRRLEQGRMVGADGVILSWRHRTEPDRGGDDAIVSRRAWTNESVHVLRLQYASGTTRYRVGESHRRHPYRRTAYNVARTLSDENAAIVASDTDADPPTYALESRNLSEELGTSTYLDRVETSRIRAVVIGTGVLKRASVRYAGMRDGAPAVASSTVRFDTDPETVTRPEWVETALEQQPRENETTVESTQATG